MNGSRGIHIPNGTLIVSGYSQVPIGVKYVMDGATVLVSPPYLETLLYELRKHDVDPIVVDCGLFFEVSVDGAA